MIIKQQLAAIVRKRVVAVFCPCPVVCIMLLGKEALKSGMANISWDCKCIEEMFFFKYSIGKARLHLTETEKLNCSVNLIQEPSKNLYKTYH